MSSREDVDGALRRLEEVLRPRVGRRATALVLKNLVGLRESGLDDAGLLGVVHQTLDAYARVPESGTPFPLGIAKAIGDLGCLKLPVLSTRMHPGGQHGLGLLDTEARAVAQHADALLPAYGEDDADFAVRVAWRSAHHHRLHLVVGRTFPRHDNAPTELLHEAWRRQGARGIPVAVVPGDFGCPGVLYASGPPPSAHVLERTRVDGFFFQPHAGDPISLDDVPGLQRFFARVPLPISPRTLAWIVHLVRLAFPARLVEVEDRLNVAWEDREETPPLTASLLLGVPPPPVEERARLRLRTGDVELVYAPGELSA